MIKFKSITASQSNIQKELMQRHSYIVCVCMGVQYYKSAGLKQTKRWKSFFGCAPIEMAKYLSESLSMAIVIVDTHACFKSVCERERERTRIDSMTK